MLKTSGDYEKEFIEESKQKTGKTVPEWMDFIKASGKEKRNDIMDWLKKDLNINHLQASLLTGMFLNEGKPVYIDETNLLDNQFEKCPDMRPVYEAMADKIVEVFPETRIIPKKTYISFNGKREYAAMNIRAGEIRLGLDLGEKPFDGKIQKSKLTGPMPRISHMLVLNKPENMDELVVGLLRESYQRTHP